jgi:RimJ/RimL family protein N-acetyltransferase
MRQWRDSDREPFAAMSADSLVMEYFPSTLTRDVSDRSIDAWQVQFQERGWSNWAMELKETGEFIGYVGLTVPVRQLPFSPYVEIGWRLAHSHWGKGYATEGAREAVAEAFNRIGLDELVSFTAAVNQHSWAVMERLGMRRDQDFDYPAFAEGHHLRPHRLYRLRRGEWRKE